MARQRIVERRLAVAATLAMVFAGLPALTGHARAAVASTTAIAADEPTALAEAQSSAQPVEALSDRTEFAQTFVNPDGSFTDNVSATQQRVQLSDGTWADIDTTLQAQSDGTLAPAASPTRSALSGGGGAPVVTVWQDDSWGGGTLAVTWPAGALPAPTVSGDTATYPGVVPGVDLQVTASDQGADLALVVNSAQAAANLTTFSLGLSAPGFTLSAGSAGNVMATDSLGGDAFDVSAPRVWDSAAGGSGSSGPGPSVLQAPASASLSGGTLTVTPDQGMLTGTGTFFPVFIGLHVHPREPSVTVHGPRGGWMDVARDNQGGQWGEWQPHGKLFSNTPKQALAPVGPWCNDDGSGKCIAADGKPAGYRGEHRSYLNFPIPSRIWDSDPSTISATLFTNDVWTWTCSVKTQVELWQTTFASRDITQDPTPWDHRPSEQQQQSTSAPIAFGHDSGCPAAGVQFTATGAAKRASAGHLETLTLELRATTTDENNYNKNARKIFSVSKFSDPFLQIHYDHPPEQPTNTQVLDGSRVFRCFSPAPIFVSTKSPTLRATINDPNKQFSGNISALFPWAEVGTGSPSGKPKTGAHAPGDFTTQLSGLPDDKYRWQAQGIDSANFTGPLSPACDFHVDTSPPATPVISPPPGYSGTTPIGAVTTFKLSDPGNRDPTDHVNDVVGYRYGFSDPPINFVPAIHEGGPASVPISPVWNGSRTLYVQAVDRAGNLSPDSSTSPPAELSITSLRPANNPTPLLAWWKLGEGSKSTAHDATGNGHDATLGAQAGWGSVPSPKPTCVSSGTSALSLTGTSDSEAATAPQIPPLDNTGSFTVSACVKLSPPSACVQSAANCSFYNAVSMDGVHASPFTLEFVDSHWCGTIGCWAFVMPTKDDNTSPPINVLETTTAVAFNTWVQLTGVYDQSHQQMLFYVNGSLVGATNPVTVQPWPASAMGPLRIGRVLFNDGAWNWWPGEISDVCVFWGALDATQVQNVFNGGCGSAGAPQANVPPGA